MKIDYYSALHRLLPYWTDASSLQNANLPCRRLFRFWVLSPEDYKEPEEAFNKVDWDEVGFVGYFPNKSTSAHIGSSEWWEDCSRKKKLTESYKIHQSAFIAPFYGKKQEITPV